jgi:L-asparaginase
LNIPGPSRAAPLLGTLLALLAAPAPDAQSQDLPTVVVLSTGGTIASAYDSAAGGYVAALSGEQLVAAVPGLIDVARVEVENVASVGSTNMTPGLWLEVSTRANRALDREDVAGVVVTHGTDTLEETAFFLDLTLRHQKPVVLVGSQRAASEADSDGPRNLLNAVRVAAAAEARGMGAMIAMNGAIHAAREVTKTHSLALETFDTPEFGALGVVDAGGVRFYRAPLGRQSFPLEPESRLATVDIVPVYAGADGRAIRGLMDQGGLDGLVVEAAGAGNLSTPLYRAILEARAEGIPVVITSRVHAGPVLPLYGGEGGGVSLLEAGCIFADNLSAQKARVLLIVAMARTSDSRGLQEIFSR